MKRIKLISKLTYGNKWRLFKYEVWNAGNEHRKRRTEGALYTGPGSNSKNPIYGRAPFNPTAQSCPGWSEYIDKVSEPDINPSDN